MWTKSWQNKRPGWTRRVRWFPQKNGNIRLEFVEREADQPDGRRSKHSVTVNPEMAEKIWALYCHDHLDHMTGRDIFFAVKEEQEG